MPFSAEEEQGPVINLNSIFHNVWYLEWSCLLEQYLGTISHEDVWASLTWFSALKRASWGALLYITAQQIAYDCACTFKVTGYIGNSMDWFWSIFYKYSLAGIIDDCGGMRQCPVMSKAQWGNSRMLKNRSHRLEAVVDVNSMSLVSDPPEIRVNWGINQEDWFWLAHFMPFLIY